MLSLFGALIGLVSSAVPTVIGYFQKKQDYAHELALGEQQIRAQAALAGQQLQAIETQGKWDEVKALIEAQARPSGVKWVDGLSTFIRPFLTLYWCCFLYTLVMIARYLTILHAGPDVKWTEAVIVLWGDDEKMLVSAIFMYWFGERGFKKLLGR